MSKKINNQTMNIAMPILLAGSSEFSPTKLCQKVVYCWCMQAEDEIRKALANDNEAHESEKIMSLPQICVAMGHNRQNAYHWQRRPGWKNWFHAVVEETINTNFLPSIQLNLARRAAQTHDSSLIKIALERFDKKYKPTTASELRHTLPGVLPKETTRELAERSRKRKAIQEERISAELDAEEAARKEVKSIVVEPAPNPELVKAAEDMEL